MYVRTYVSMYLSTIYLCTYVRMYAFMYVCIYLSIMYVCMYVGVCALPVVEKNSLEYCRRVRAIFITRDTYRRSTRYTRYKRFFSPPAFFLSVLCFFVCLCCVCDGASRMTCTDTATAVHQQRWRKSLGTVTAQLASCAVRLRMRHHWHRWHHY